jgi:hypothetical protein
MKKNFYFPLLLIAFVSMMFTSCNEDDTTPDASTGVIVRSAMRDGAVVYATVHQVVGNRPMDTVIVTDPSGAVYGLHENEGNPYVFVLEPTLADYKATPPTDGSFSYKVKFQGGEEKIFSNSIVDPYVAPSENISVTKATVNNQQVVVLTWTAVPNAEAYTFTVTAGTTQIYYSNQPFTLATGENGKINFPLSGFSGYTGQNIQFKIVAYDLINNSAVINSTSWSTTTWVAD